jgi:hypothetical protein
MGLNTAGGVELCPQVATGTLASVAAGAGVMIMGPFNATLVGTTFTGSVNLERSFDGGATYMICGIDASGSPATYTTDASLVVNEPEPGVWYRFNMTARSAGSMAWRISGGQRLT